MKFIFVLFFAFKFLSAVSVNTELDLSSQHLDDVAFSSRLDDGLKHSDATVTMHVSQYGDGFAIVREGSLLIWDQSTANECEYVKVFSTSEGHKAVKLGIFVKVPEGLIRTESFSLYYLREPYKWRRVSRQEYLNFIKPRFGNFIDTDYEADEKFDAIQEEECIVESGDESEEETRKKEEADRQSLKRAREAEAEARVKRYRPTQEMLDTHGPTDIAGVEYVPEGEVEYLPRDYVPRKKMDLTPPEDKEPETMPLINVKKEEDLKQEELQEHLRRKKQKGSFLTASVTLPSLLLLLYASH